MDSTTVHARRWYILGVLVICLLIVILDNTILNVALKTIQEDLGATQGEMEWSINSYMLVFAGLLFTWGVLGDRFGRRRMLTIGLVLFGAASVLAAFSDSPGQLIATRALMGIGAAAVMPQTLSIVTNVFEPAERGRAIAVWAGFSGMAIALGPVVGGLLLEHFWWGSIFLVNVPIAVVAVVAIALLVPESKNPDQRRVDPAGVLLSVVALVSLVYGIIEGGERGEWLSLAVAGPIAAGLALLALFVLVERRSSHPALDVTLFRDPRFTASTVAVSAIFFAMSGSSFYLSYYLQSVRGYQPLEAGFALVPAAAAIMIAAPRSAALARRFGTRLVCAVGLALAGAGMGAFAFIGTGTPLWIALLAMFVMGLGMGNVIAPATEAIMSVVPREKAGAGSAVNTTVRQVGGALGVAVLGSMMSAAYRGHLGDAVDVLPPQYREGAGESIGGTAEAVARTGQAVRDGAVDPSAAGGLAGLLDAARESFTHAMHVASVGSLVAALVGVVVAAAYLPGRARQAAVPAVDGQGDTRETADVVG